MKCPGGYSNSVFPRRVKPSFRQIAFEGAFSTDGKACRNRCFPSDLAMSIARLVPIPAMPRPWNAGSTNQPIS